MSNLIWAKGATTAIDDRIMRFCAGEDVILDRHLFLYDIRASKAHALGLLNINILSQEEYDSILEGLEELTRSYEEGNFILDERYEDGHSAIEAFLIEKLGDAGKRIHTGRSRNDQVLVATRLFLKDTCQSAGEIARRIATVALDCAESTMMQPMPGYTHLQRAVPSSVGMWFAAIAESFIDDANLCQFTSSYIDSNPLGTAAGYGVNLPLDRKATTEALGFDRMQISPIYAQNSRGKFELQVIDTLSQLLLGVRRIAWDLSLYATGEFAFVDLPDAYTTGSSIMPNKRNPDVVELLRAAYSVVAGARAEIQSVLSLPSGYHRDLQNTKPPLIRAVNHALAALDLVPDLLANLTFDDDALRAAISDDMYATDVAVELAASGVPFREAYRQAAADTEMRSGRDPAESLQKRVSAGGAANPLLLELRDRLKKGSR